MNFDASKRDINSLIDDINDLTNTIQTQNRPVSDSLHPRYLTNKEIINIVKSIPTFSGATSAVGIVARNSIIRQEKNKLREIVLTPDALKEFKNVYISKFNFSKVEPGTPVGLTASEAISAPLSQQTFNAFSNAGNSKNMRGGIDSFIETLEVQYRRYPMMVIHFKEKVTTDDILLKKKHKILTVTVADCVASSTVETTTSLYMNKIPDWYSFYKSIVDPSVIIPTNGWILRLYLNLDALYLYKITPMKIANLLSSEKDKNGVSIVKCIYSPTLIHDGVKTIIMDLFINNMDALISIKEKEELKIDDNMLGLFYFKNIFIPKLNTFKLQGFDNITDFDAIIIPIQMSLYAEYPVSRYADEYTSLKNKYINYHFIKLNTVHMNFNNIKISDVILLLQSIGIKNIIHIKDLPENDIKNAFDDIDLLVELPPRTDDIILSEDEYYGILPLVKFYIDKDNKEVDAYRKAQKIIRRDLLDKAKMEKGETRDKLYNQAIKLKIYREPTIISKSANLYYVETTGSDYYSVLNNPDIDYTRSYTNDIKDTLLYYGIEAVRSYIVRDLLKLVQISDSYIDPRHVGLVADWMTCLGIITPLTAKGMKKHELGAIAHAAFREPMKGFKNEAMYNKVDKLSGVAGPIAIGTYIEMGTGFVEVRPINNIRTKAMIEAVKKQGKKISTSTASKIVSLLETPDLINPLDRSKPDINTKFQDLNLVMIPGITTTKYEENLSELLPFPSLKQIFPIVSKELKQAVEQSETCERPLIPIKTTIKQTGSIYMSQQLPVSSVNTSGVSQFIPVEKPPEVITGTNFNIEDLF